MLLTDTSLPTSRRSNLSLAAVILISSLGAVASLLYAADHTTTVGTTPTVARQINQQHTPNTINVPSYTPPTQGNGCSL